ncbi:MAG: cupin domain-containing protein [Lachnospiraceae bacterium]|nr:cupin domain-containing protein [Candidatus Equihabitans merdae]
MVRQFEGFQRSNDKGGKGCVMIYPILPIEECKEAFGRLFARVIMTPGSAIEVHTHIGETEPYYIMSGTGLFTEPDGSKVEVKAGDTCTIKPGESHGLENIGDTDLEMIALVYNVQ